TLWTMLKEPLSNDIYALARDFDRVFGLSLSDYEEEKSELAIPENVKAIAEERLIARKNRDWAKSDELRDKLAALGYAVKDTKEGYELSAK
ncbi:MAG: cysteine--tRNA ligase, partial [Clostridia bacterium]|nr:cysteine--tRNA ligase [Clostridia bacterium]